MGGKQCFSWSCPLLFLMITDEDNFCISFLICHRIFAWRAKKKYGLVIWWCILCSHPQNCTAGSWRFRQAAKFCEPSSVRAYPRQSRANGHVRCVVFCLSCAHHCRINQTQPHRFKTNKCQCVCTLVCVQSDQTGGRMWKRYVYQWSVRIIVN